MELREVRPTYSHKSVTHEAFRLAFGARDFIGPRTLSKKTLKALYPPQ